MEPNTNPGALCEGTGASRGNDEARVLASELVGDADEGSWPAAKAVVV